MPAAPQMGAAGMGMPQIPPMDPAMMMGAAGGPPPPSPSPIDPVLQQLLGGPLTPPQKTVIPKPFAKMKAPDLSAVRLVVTDDENRHQYLLTRFNRDLMLYRQHMGFVPPGHNSNTDLNFQSSEMSNVINKLANMCSSLDMIVESPFKDEQTKEASQAVEDFVYYCRDYEKEVYANSGGGTLQWDEFWYLFLYGRLVYMVLPDEGDDEYPFRSALLDPSTCFPTWGDEKEGLIRMTRVYVSTVAEIVSTWGEGDPSVQQKLVKKLGYGPENVNEWMNHEYKVKEYWDRTHHAVLVDDIDILPPVEHGLGILPFVYVTARGEPKGVYTPQGQYQQRIDEFMNAGYVVGRGQDLAEKGVSVFHHLVNTHKLREIMNTLLLMEAMKSQNPATITYSAPHLMGKEPPPLNNKPGGNNQRVLNLQKIEGIPTSPRPTDVAPVMNQIQQDMTQGTIPPHVFGAEQGSNVSGFAVESLIAAAKDAILPYVNAWQTAQQLKAKLKLHLYRHIISPVTILSVPATGAYGMNYVRAVTPEMVDAVGTRVKISLFGIAQQNLPGQISAALQAVEGGIWSTRKAMEHVGVKNPDRMLADIIAERAIQHPALMETFIIPNGFIKQGMEELARIWLQLVVAPQMGQLMGTMDPAAQAPEGPMPNGQSAPMQGQQAPPPGGPQPGQGRGPAPQ